MSAPLKFTLRKARSQFSCDMRAPLSDLFLSQPPPWQDPKREAWSDDIGVAHLKQEKFAPTPQELSRIYHSKVKVLRGVNHVRCNDEIVVLRLEALLEWIGLDVEDTE